MSLCYNTIPDEYVVEKTHERSLFNHTSTDVSELNLFHKKPVVTPFQYLPGGETFEGMDSGDLG